MADEKAMFNARALKNRKERTMCPVCYIIVPCYNEEECLTDSYQQLRKKLDQLKEKTIISELSRIVFCDDGSSDRTWSIIDSISKTDSSVVGIKLAHNVGHQNVLLAGLNYACNKCDITITIDADLQQDINAIDQFIDSYERGNDVVFGIRESRNTDGRLKRLTAESFYSLMRLLGTEVIPNHADYRLLSNKANLALQSYGESNLFLRGLVTQLGFQSDKVYFKVKERTAGVSKYTKKKMIKLALDGITSFSIAPLRLITLMGFIDFLVSLCMIVFFVASYILGNTVPGWASILCSLWFLCGTIILSVGVCGEYIGKTYIESKHRPRYIIDQIAENANDGERIFQ